MARAPEAVQSVSRALDLLEVLEAAGGTATISDLSTETGMAPATAHRLLRTLINRGYVRQLPDRRYCLGTRLAPLGAAAGALLGDLVGPRLRRVAIEVGESANLAILAGARAEYVAQAPGTRALRMFTEVGRRVPLHSTGVGKALLALHSDDEVRRLLRGQALTAQAPNTITDLPTLLADLAEVRERGYAIDDEEMEVGVRCVAVPVRATPLMAVSVSGPTVRMTSEQIEQSVAVLTRAADALPTSFPVR